RIEGIDATVTKIANQHVSAERAEVGRCQGQPPGGVERPLRREASDQVPIGVEDIDEPITSTSHIIVMDRVLQGKGDIEMIVNGLDAERRKTLGGWPRYRTVARQRRVGEGRDQIERGIELLDCAEAEIGGEQEVPGAAAREGQAFVNRTRKPVLTHS